PAHGAGVPGGVLARIARAIAGVRRARIAVVRAPGAGAHLGVARAGRARARAVLGGIALPRGGAAHDEARQEAVRRTGTARPVACLVHVAGAGRRAADRARVPRGVLAGVVRPVAGAGRRTAHRARVPGGVLADDVRPVAGVGGARAAVVGARGAGRRLVVRRTARPRARTVLRRVALARRGPADDGRGLEDVGRARAARPVARRVDVARARRRTTDCTGVACRVLAVVAG